MLISKSNSIRNVCLYSGEWLWGPIIEHFKAEGIWDYVMWLAPCSDANYQVNNSYMSNIDHKQYKGTGENIYDEIYKILYIFIDMYSRNSSYGQNKYNSKTIHDLLNIFNRLIDYYSYHLTKNKINLVIFPRAPHSGHDYVLYKVSKELGIETLIFEQSLFPNKFFYYFNNEDYGLFKTAHYLTTANPFSIEKKFEKPLFYMKKNKLIRRRNFANYFNLKIYINFLKKTFLKSNFIRMIYELLDKQGRGQAIFRYQIEKDYKKFLNSIVQKNFSLEKNYIYFGLHLQPEKTTSNWGGKYNDQVLAIERLSKLIPEDWYIYVKENPKQTGFMRGKWFFERLRSIKNVVFVPKTANTYELQRNCQFASTITGTLGWEVITGGKNVLIFGWGVWYKTLPGVFYYNENFKIEDILNYKIDHCELETKLGLLYSKMADGVVYPHYDIMVDGFSEAQNTMRIIDSIKKILYK